MRAMALVRPCNDPQEQSTGRKSTSDSRLWTRASRSALGGHCPTFSPSKDDDGVPVGELGEAGEALDRRPLSGSAVRQWMTTCAPSEGSSCICVSSKWGGSVVVMVTQNSTLTAISAAISLAWLASSRPRSSSSHRRPSADESVDPKSRGTRPTRCIISATTAEYSHRPPPGPADAAPASARCLASSPSSPTAAGSNARKMATKRHGPRMMRSPCSSGANGARPTSAASACCSARRRARRPGAPSMSSPLRCTLASAKTRRPNSAPTRSPAASTLGSRSICAGQRG